MFFGMLIDQEKAMSPFRMLPHCAENITVLINKNGMVTGMDRGRCHRNFGCRGNPLVFPYI